jgi:tetratricopeptide (TPR) repeat protein
MPNLLRSCIPLTVALCLTGGSPASLAQSDSTPTIGAFVFGDKGAAAREAEHIERSLRGFIHTTGLYKNVRLNEVLDAGTPVARESAIAEARALLQQGKSDYEQLDLEKAQGKFQKALKKLEYGYGYLRDPGPLLECALHLGATWVLVGEPEKASQIFMRAYALPGPKVLDPNLFPPNIQDIFNQAMQSAEAAPNGTVKLITAPVGARIYIDGTYRGVSPLKVKRIRAGSHLVRALKDGYRPWGGKITATAGKSRSLKMNLKPTARFTNFSAHFKSMVTEAIQQQPGPAAQSLAGFIDASYLAIVVAQGPLKRLKLSGYHIEIGDDFKIASHQEVLDATENAFHEKLSGFFGALLATTPETPKVAVAAATPSQESSEGEAAAAALLAGSESGEESGGSYGLDLDDGQDASEESGAQPESSAEMSGEGTVAQATEGKTPQEKALDDSLKEAKKEEKTNGEESTWSYLSSSWWFWTTVGVVVAGAATGTYFLLDSGGEEGGSLVLGLH